MRSSCVRHRCSLRIELSGGPPHLRIEICYADHETSLSLSRVTVLVPLSGSFAGLILEFHVKNALIR